MGDFDRHALSNDQFVYTGRYGLTKSRNRGAQEMWRSSLRLPNELNYRIEARSFPTQAAKGCNHCICSTVENAGLEVSFRG